MSKRWITANGCSSIFPAAARAGYNPATILTKLHDLGFQPNGVVVNPMHMLENSSVVPNTVNEMLLQSHEGIIRLFPVWPRQHDARFRTLRADGAFLVSASLGGGTVREVRILSEKGRDCIVQNPWPECQVRLIRNGHDAGLIGGDTIRFGTNPGDSIDLTPVGVAQRLRSPVSRRAGLTDVRSRRGSAASRSLGRGQRREERRRPRERRQFIGAVARPTLRSPAP